MPSWLPAASFQPSAENAVEKMASAVECSSLGDHAVDLVEVGMTWMGRGCLKGSKLDLNPRPTGLVGGGMVFGSEDRE